MPTDSPLSLIAELTYRCPLHCPYCSNPVPLDGARRRDELTTAQWTRVFEQAAQLGVLQLGLTGGEPMLRRDLEALTAAASRAGLYTTLVTSGVPFSPARAGALRAAGLDHVQVSLQDSDAAGAALIAGRRCFERKLEAARQVVALGLPLTINVVVHRHNLGRVAEMIDLAHSLGAQRLELANAQYHGWAAVNRSALMPMREQLEAAEHVVARARERLASRLQILWVLSDYHEEYPKPCMGGWGRQAIVVTPTGDALPCHSASALPGLEFPNVREHPLAAIWFDSQLFNRFRGTGWMTDPCRSCPLGRQQLDFGGCRCQAFWLTGRPEATDPACHLSPQHGVAVSARRTASEAMVYRRVGTAERRHPNESAPMPVSSAD